MARQNGRCRVLQAWLFISHTNLLAQIYEALQQKREADEVGKTTDPDKVQSSIGKLLKGLGRHVALDVAGCVESMAAWKHNP